MPLPALLTAASVSPGLGPFPSDRGGRQGSAGESSPARWFLMAQARLRLLSGEFRPSASPPGPPLSLPVDRRLAGTRVSRAPKHTATGQAAENIGQVSPPKTSGSRASIMPVRLSSFGAIGLKRPALGNATMRRPTPRTSGDDGQFQKSPNRPIMERPRLAPRALPV
jgi:hypothetical protein